MSPQSLTSRCLVVLAVCLLLGSTLPIVHAQDTVHAANDVPAFLSAIPTTTQPETAVEDAEIVRFFLPNLQAEISSSGAGQDKADVPDPKQAAIDFMRSGINESGSEIGLLAASKTDWYPLQTTLDPNGTAHVTLQNHHNGLPVFAARAVVHLNKQGTVIAANGEFPAQVTLGTKPTLSPEALRKAALQLLKIADPVILEEELLILNPALLGADSSQNHLAYRFLLSDQARSIMQVLFLDAHSGKLLFAYDQMVDNRNRQVVDLHNGTGTGGTACYNEDGPIPGGAPSADCVGAFTFGGSTYDYFWNIHGRDSFDNQGAPMLSWVNYGNEANAYWDGTGTTFGPGFATKDVVAHEWTHAVTQYSAGLIYANQSGALNESMSDIFGAMLDREDWLVGEDTPIGTLRDMANPNAFGNPGAVGDDEYYCGTGDGGGVHYNSGVPNHAAYLMAEGGTYNNVTVAPIGREATERIFYRTLTRYLTSGSDFVDAADGLISACTDLYGAASSTCGSVEDAIAATEMRQPACGVSTSQPDSYEDDDNFGQAQAILPNDPAQSHNFHDANDYDWIKFTAQAGVEYTFATLNLANRTDTVLSLFSTDGVTLLAQNDDNEPSLASWLSWTAPSAGTYYVQVRNYNAQTFGTNTDYDLRFTSTVSQPNSADSFEPDNTSTAASAIALDGSSQTHNFHAAADGDWVFFDATAGNSLRIETSELGEQSDTVIELYASDTTTMVATDDDSGTGLASLIEWIAPTNGRYYLRIRPYASDQVGADTQYKVQISLGGTTADSFEPDNDVAQATTIATDGTSQTHNIHQAGDIDWVKFTAITGSSYQIETFELGNQADTWLELYAPDGSTLLAADDDSAGGFASRIVWVSPSTGDYYLRLRHYGQASFGSETNYNLHITVGDISGSADAYEDDDNPIVANDLAVNGSAQSHNFHDGSDYDWIRVVADAGVQYTIYTYDLGARTDTVLELYAQDAETLLASNDDGGGGLASSIAWTAQENTLYYVRVRAYSGDVYGAETNYELALSGIGDSSADVYEEDDIADQAGFLSGSQTNHNFHDAGDTDWVMWSADAGITYILETRNLGSRSDTVLQLYANDKVTLLAADDDSGGNLASRLLWTAPNQDTYYARIVNYSAGLYGANTNYDLRVGEFVTGADVYEPDNGPGDATVHSADGSLQPHNFHTPGDIDWVKFNATSGVNYAIQTRDLGQTSDTIITLYAPDGVTVLAQDDDNGEGLASLITWSPSADGEYFVAIYHYQSATSGDTTSYNLQIISGIANGDVYEPDNQPAQATSIATDGTLQSHTLHIQGDDDWLRFTTVAGGRYAIETLNLSPGTDTYLSLYDTDATTLLLADDDSGIGYASQIDWVAPTDGEYYVKARHYNSNQAGSDIAYDVRIRHLTDSSGDLYEPDNTSLLASPIAVNDGPQTRNFHLAGDNDYIRFTMVAGATYVIATTAIGASSDTVVDLYAPDGSTWLITDDDSGEGLASRVEWTAQTDGEYFIVVRQYGNQFFGPATEYQIAVSSNSIIGPDFYESDDTELQAAPFDSSTGEVQTHTFHQAGDVDWVYFNGVGGSGCLLETGNLGNQSDTYLELYNSSLELLAYDDDNGVGLASRIVLTSLPSTDTYYAKVRHYSDMSFGPSTQYELHILCAAGGLDSYESDNSMQSASWLEVDGSVQSHGFHSGGDADWVQFAVTGGATYVIETLNLAANSDTVMYLLDQDGATVLQSSDDEGGGRASQIIWTAPTDGLYYAYVAHYSNEIFGSDTTYEVRITTFASLVAQKSSVQLVNSVVQNGDEVEAWVYLNGSATEIKIEALAKSAYLRLIEAVPADANGLTKGTASQGNDWQVTVSDAGLVSVSYDGKLNGDGMTPVLRLRWQLITLSQVDKLSIPFQITILNEKGQESVEKTAVTIASLGANPKIDRVTPASVEHGTNTTLSIYGSNFQPVPKVFLVSGSERIQLIDVELINPEPGNPFLQVLLPSGIKAGSYKVSVVNPDQTNTEYDGIEILSAPQPPVAEFSGTPVSGNAPLVVQFSDQSTGSITLWQWSFGDNQTSTQQSPSHTYAAPGTYSVQLTVSGPGGSNGKTRTNYITVSQAPVAPVAEFSGTPVSGNAPLVVQFSDQSTGSITSWQWDFGDSGTSTQQSPSHTYAAPGTYSVQLTVSGPGGSNSKTRTNYITVSQAPVAPVAEFSGTPVSGNAPLVVQFSDQSTGSITSWQWDFGDSGTSTQQSPSHTYAAPGTYSVQLTVSGPGGSNSQTRTNYITVSQAPVAPVAEFSGTPVSGNAPLVVQFSDQSTGSITSWQWDFGDSGTSTQQSPSHTYVSPGNYSVQLTVSGPGGSNTRQRAQYIHVSEAPAPTDDIEWLYLPHASR